jgi:hypothetical protein
MSNLFKEINKNLIKHKLFSFLIVLFGFIGILFLQARQFDSGDELLSSRAESPAKTAETAREHCLNKSGFEDRGDCYAEYFYELTLQGDTNRAVKGLFELQKLDDSAKSCHFILHSIGRATFDKEPDKWRENLQKMPEECDYGGLHGILEGYQASGGEVDKNTIPTLCGKDDEGGCMHAVGHLVLVEEKNDLIGALDLCEVSATKQRQHHCMAGAFMERMIPRNLIAHGFLSPDKINNWWGSIEKYEEMCRSFTGERQLACWTEISHAAVNKFNGNPQMIFDFCNTGPTQEAANYCRRHIIIDFVGISKYDLIGLKRICKLGPVYDPQFEEDCYIEIVKAAQSGFQPKDKLNDFCSSLEETFKKVCYRHISQSASRSVVNR